ncbi:hypothetical protein Hanom_Chr11g01061501 [Helianthus anomalus]
MMDDIQRWDNLLDTAKARESYLLAKKPKAEVDLKRVTSNLAEERVAWARDIQEKEMVIAHALKVQGSCREKSYWRRKRFCDLDVEKSRRAESENATNQALAEAQELSAQLVALKEEKSWWVSHCVTSCFEFLRRSTHFSSLLDDMATAAYETG